MDDEQFKEAIIQFIKEYYKKHKKGPATRKIFEKFRTERNVKKRFRKILGGIANAYKLAGIPVPEARIKQTRKAFEARKKKLDAEATPLQDLEQSYQIQQREEQRRKEFAEKRAKEMAILLQDPNEAISRLVLDAMEKTALPILLKKKYGIDASVPEILGMLKQFKKADEEGWSMESILEWIVLSKEQQDVFIQLCEQAYKQGETPYRLLPTLKDEVDKTRRDIETLKNQKWKLLLDIGEWKNKILACKDEYNRLNSNLKYEYEEKERKLIHGMRERQSELQHVETQVAQLKIQRDHVKAELTESMKERDVARSELEKLRQTVGPAGAVTDLAKEKDRLKQQIKDVNRQTADISVQLAGKWLNQEESIFLVNQEKQRFMKEVEHMCRAALDERERQIKNAGPGIYVYELLKHDLPTKKFHELVHLVMMAEVERESGNSNNLFFAHLPTRKSQLLKEFPAIEECKRVYNERVEAGRKSWEARVEEIRRVASDMSKMQMGVEIFEAFAKHIGKPMLEAFLDRVSARNSDKE